MVPEEDVVGGESYRLSNSEGEADSVHTSDTNTTSSTAQTHTTTNTDSQVFSQGSRQFVVLCYQLGQSYQNLKPKSVFGHMVGHDDTSNFVAIM